MTKLTVDQRIAAFVKLGDYIRSKPERLGAYVSRSSFNNGWFTIENQWLMLMAIAEDYLTEAKLQAWVNSYPSIRTTTSPSKKVGLVMAGNLPLVGFHDWLSVLMSGNIAQVKLSDKDPYVLSHLVEKLEDIEPAMTGATLFVERLAEFDAVIATGSDNTSRYFKQYFGKYPHIIRGNRTSVAVLHGNETRENFQALAKDIFTYFGMGCRSVGKLYVPRDYDFDPLLAELHEYKHLANHTKWKNNFDYNYAMHTINKQDFYMTGSLLLREDKALHSRLATVHYEYYDDLADVAIDLHAKGDELQAIVSAQPVGSLPVIALGEGQRPALDDYADGVDVMEFLVGLR